MKTAIIALIQFNLLFAGMDSRAASAKATKNLKCSPSKITGSSMLSVILPKPHGGNFAIVNPKGDYLFIAFSQPDKKSAVQPIMSASMFQKLPEFKLKIDSAKAWNWETKANAKEPI